MRLLLVRTAGLALLVTTSSACGGDGPKPAARPTSPRASSSTPAPPALSPPPSGLPPLSPMPPPGVAGSKKATRKTDPALFACGGGASSHAKDPEALVKRLGEACAAAGKMKPAGALLRGQQADHAPAQEQKVRAEAGKCYRIVFATDEGVKDAVAMLRDSAGDLVAESAGAALPVDGTVCFAASDEVTFLVGIGAGKGSWAAQVWSN
ncbi:MAG: hypothetical protein JWP97_992 [Labilithrix sp.]|nr:hypothetical protein [Labilithrix sp.]